MSNIAAQEKEQHFTVISNKSKSWWDKYSCNYCDFSTPKLLLIVNHLRDEEGVL